MKQFNLAIIGGGPAGMAAALQAYELGVKDIVILERDNSLGGILNQCIHNGFGLHVFKEELTGPEYALRFSEKIKETNITVMLDTMVIGAEKDKTLYAVNPEYGFMVIKAKAVILAMGCRERPRGALRIPGSNCAGVFTAGTAQRFVNIEGILPGKKVVILGSGDIGLIMARRMTLEGIKVMGVYEIMEYPGGLTRNIVQCLDDYDIPLHLSETVVKIHGKGRITGVTTAKVDSNMKPIKGTEQYVECDTLLLSVGLIPENELSEQMGVGMYQVTGGPFVDQDLETDTEGVFACGNVLHVHDLVDYVTMEGQRAAMSAKAYLDKTLTEKKSAQKIAVVAGNGLRYVLPQHIYLKDTEEKIKIFFRSRARFREVYVRASVGDNVLTRRKLLRLIPSEMESVDIKMRDLLNTGSETNGFGDLVIEVEQ
ncbi:MAG TPA: FAD-dependent oxidoreductase [Clostridia bacterium]|nr:FAD-dependent oxidoreductase [Clostridia bacterium]HOM33810.1 FAD-dependent oxidoreductase [Clostridia bacterium]HOR89112.1 FAD-dependent oxidoreductase [Clostridia bacterium]HOT69884.1 FAD-dependent oxidoreductase [Clostridia bacterium]HQF99530.1 FAD-dependent oxidoreductase [Clostridia bacterium]